ncbi:hypothetical protein GPECTOR_6g811 [Gonium pectorale]|uniref:Glycosyl transferase CAP10 domain-containing protein n=1 Tax=Gonium pectorale TaxID=33097 RepID=A0A150GVV7_GONPE|nr:hypothetical protein GPECTOR_6g811 [Gonium pectorale]|eukprot:KXZ53893.1 hypothetical protein GPECTOR_6g811 [Gonium pectorale]
MNKLFNTERRVMMEPQRLASAVAVALLVAAAQQCLATLTPRVEFTEVPLGQPDVSDEDWRAFLSENLEADLAPWRSRAPLRANDTLALHEQLLRLRPLPAVIKLGLVYDNRLYWINRGQAYGEQDGEDGLTKPASPWKEAFHRRVGHLLSSGRLSLPNVLFVLSTEDNRDRLCAPARGCPAPLLSQFKTVGEPDGDDLDILLPQFMFANNAMYNHPWHLKKDVAFFRGSPYCSGYWYWKVFTCAKVCPRTYLAYKSYADSKAMVEPPVLDVGLTRPLYVQPGTTQCVPADDVPPSVDRVPLANHTYYKWLLHLESYTASCRLSQLMMTNSLVLMQQMPFLEYYYRSLRPGVHYVPFWNMSSPGGINDVYDVVRQLRERDAADPEYVQAIIQRAQTFAVSFTGASARARYLQDALTAYKGLFADMDPFIEQLVRELRAQGMRIG